MSCNNTTYTPVNKEELISEIYSAINEKGIDVNLNYIDVSNITDMSYLFKDLPFNGNLSKWNVSNVKNMKGMFVRSSFNGDISNWKTTKAARDINGDFIDKEYILNRKL